MNNDFLQLSDSYNTTSNTSNIFDDVDIIIDPELEDESTVDINNYLNKFILQCRICGNLFPSNELLDNETECPICGSMSSDGFVFKGKLKSKNDKNMDSDKKQAMDDLHNETLDDGQISVEGDFDVYKKSDLSDNYI